jgi:ferritin-like metal-binding protein YciE
MAISTLDDLFYDTLRDIYYAEKKLVKALPKLAKKANNEDLSEAFTNHAEETEGQVGRLEEIFKMIGKAARAKKCPAMDGLVEETNEIVEDAEEDAVLDAGVLAAAQAVEHYEIARYGALVEWAKLLGHDDAVSLLEESLNEEKAADELLTSLSEVVNAASNREEEDEDQEAAE